MSMLSKCIGIISYFPDDAKIREERKKRFNKLMYNINTYFRLPVVIIAQNWRDNDFNVDYDYDIDIVKFNKPLGITGARIELRKKLLSLNYDYFILTDDDTNLTTISQEGVDQYLLEIDQHPRMFGLFHGHFQRFVAASKYMLGIMDLDFISNMESINGDLWEDVAYIEVYKKLYPKRFFRFSRKGLDETFIRSEEDEFTTWYVDDDKHKGIEIKTKEIIKNWLKEKQNKTSIPNKVIGIISYLPDGDLRKSREAGLTNTIKTYGKLFPDIPIMIVAQNWKEYIPPKIPNTIILYKYEKGLGIVPARKILRELFIQSEFDYLIMSDDDISITPKNVDKFISLIDQHPSGVGRMSNTTTLTLFAISKDIYSKIDLIYRDPYDYFEDIFLIRVLEKHFKDKIYYFDETFNDSTWADCKYGSTWWDNKIHNVSKFQKVTDKLIDKFYI